MAANLAGGLDRSDCHGALLCQRGAHSETSPHGDRRRSPAAAAVTRPHSHGAEVLQHIPEADRLLHAVAVLSQSQTFAATGADLEQGLAGLLGIADLCRSRRIQIIREQLVLEEGLEALSELEVEQVQELVLRAHNHAHTMLVALRKRVESKHGTLIEALKLFRRNRRGDLKPGVLHLVDTSPQPEPTQGLGATPWAPALTAIGLEPGGAGGLGAALQLLAGALEAEVLPVTAVVLRLGCFPPGALASLRNILVAKYKSLPRMLEMHGGPDGQGLQASVLQADFAALPAMGADGSNVAEYMFAACDANCNGCLDLREMTNAFSIAAPPATLERLRMKVLMHNGSGNWKSALAEIGHSPGDPITPSVLVALAASVDVSYEDAHAIFRRLDTHSAGHFSGDELSHRLSVEADGFSLQELSIRLWLGLEQGTLPSQVLSQSAAIADATLPAAVFASAVFGVEPTEDQRRAPGTQPKQLAKHNLLDPKRGSAPVTAIRGIASASKKESAPAMLPSSPPLTEGEVNFVYRSLYQKHGFVSVGVLHQELMCRGILGDVLAIDRSILYPGDTVTIYYRTSNVMDKHVLLERPFVALVPIGLTYVAGGGGSWTLNRQPLSDIPGVKVPLRRGSREGAVELPVPLDMSVFGSGPFEVRLFASQDGRAGRQVGQSIPVIIQTPPPSPPVVAAEALSPNSLNLLWQPPMSSPANKANAQPMSFVVRGWPLGLRLEEHIPAIEPMAPVWSHKKQEMVSMFRHKVNNLVPGVTYQFQVSALHCGDAPEANSPNVVSAGGSQKRQSDTTSPATSPQTLCLTPRRSSTQTGGDQQSPSTPLKSTAAGRRPIFSQVEGPPSAVVEVRMPSCPAFLAAPGRPELLERGLGGELTLQWAAQEPVHRSLGGIDSATAVRNGADFVLLWDAPMLEPVASTVDAFWQFPGKYWTRKCEGGVIECIVRLPMLNSPSDKGAPLSPVARFRVLARAGEEEAIGKSGEPVELLAAGEEVVRDAAKLRELGEMVLSHGSLGDFVEAAHDAGLSGGGSKGHYAKLRQTLMANVAEAGGIDAFVGALDGVDMPTFAASCAVLRSIRKNSGPSVDDQAWNKLLKLVMEGGGPTAFTDGLGGLSIVELIQAGPSMLEAGLIRRRGASADEKGLLGDRRNASILGAFGSAFEDIPHVNEKDIHGYANMLATIVNSGGSVDDWASSVEVMAESWGSGCIAELLQFTRGNVPELVAAMQTSGCRSEDLIQLIADAHAAAFIGPNCDCGAQHAFFRRVADLGGAPILYAALEGFDLRVLTDGVNFLQSAGLDDFSCLKREAQDKSKMEKWADLAHTVEDEWGGVEVALGRAEEGVGNLRSNAPAKEQERELLKLSEKNGGHQFTMQLLIRMLALGGVDSFMADLGNLDLAAIRPIFSNVRKFGGNLVELEKIVQCANQTGGVSKHLRILLSIDDLGQFESLVEEGNAMGKALKQLRANWPELLERTRGPSAKRVQAITKVLTDIGAEKFVDAYASINLGALATLLPLLTEAGIIRKRGQSKTPLEAQASSEAFLRWVLKAGGVQRFGAALSAVEDPKCFGKCMDVLRISGLGRMHSKALSKVSNWISLDLNPSGGLEALLDSAVGINLFEACSLLRSLVEGQGDSLQDSLAALQDSLKLIVRIAVPVGGLTELIRLLKLVELDYLELMFGFLTSAGLHKPSTTLGHPAEPMDEKTQKTRKAEVQGMFEPWIKLTTLVSYLGGASNLCQKAASVDLDHFDACVEVLRAAGLVRHGHGTLEERLKRQPGNEVPLKLIDQWHQVIGLISASGGPGFFLDSMRTLNLTELLETVSLLCETGLLQSDLKESQEKREERRQILHNFNQKVNDAGGLSVFWHSLKYVDLRNVASDLRCLEILRKRMSANAEDPEDMWHIVQNPERLQDLLETVGKSAISDDDLSQKQRERITRKLQEIGGVDRFLQDFEAVRVNKSAARQLRALQEEGMSELGARAPQVIAELARLGKFVNLDLRQLKGLSIVVATLVKWTANRDSSTPEKAEALWETLNQQVVWLLGAIAENAPTVRAVQKRRHTEAPGTAGAQQEQDLTPARLAQFLQALRPLGGIQGFLTAYRGLDLATAAAQARVLHDASVRTVDTTQHLATLFNLLHHDLTQLRGLSHFVRHFGATVMVDAGADALCTTKRWQVLATSLRAAAQRDPAVTTLNKQPNLGATTTSFALNLTSSTQISAGVQEANITSCGPDHVLAVLRLGLQLDAAAGLDAISEEWVQLCSEIRNRPGGLGDVLDDLAERSGSKSGKSGMRCRDASGHTTSSHKEKLVRDLACRRCGNVLDYSPISREEALSRTRSAGSLSALHRPASANGAISLPRPDAAAADAASGDLANALAKLRLESGPPRPASANGKWRQQREAPQWA